LKGAHGSGKTLSESGMERSEEGPTNDSLKEKNKPEGRKREELGMLGKKGVQGNMGKGQKKNTGG